MRYGFQTIYNTESEYQDLTFEKLKIYYGAKGISLNPMQYKNNLGLYTADGKYNIMAQLLSDNSHILLENLGISVSCIHWMMF